MPSGWAAVLVVFVLFFTQSLAGLLADSSGQPSLRMPWHHGK
jgi:hypothetical protein